MASLTDGESAIDRYVKDTKPSEDDVRTQHQTDGNTEQKHLSLSVEEPAHAVIVAAETNYTIGMTASACIAAPALPEAHRVKPEHNGQPTANHFDRRSALSRPMPRSFPRLIAHAVILAADSVNSFPDAGLVGSAHRL